MCLFVCLPRSVGAQSLLGLFVCVCSVVCLIVRRDLRVCVGGCFVIALCLFVCLCVCVLGWLIACLLAYSFVCGCV